jgi:hypothetical protein
LFITLKKSPEFLKKILITVRKMQAFSWIILGLVLTGYFHEIRHYWMKILKQLFMFAICYFVEVQVNLEERNSLNICDSFSFYFSYLTRNNKKLIEQKIGTNQLSLEWFDMGESL